ncbi:MAG: exonuclease domain-containing protein [Ruminococcus sp.]|nr:exonuclease domain-containing protein [Ruminococcus sp.]
MNYIIMDLEWNQPVGRGNMITKPIPLAGEIIRIGAVKLDSGLKEVSRHHGCVLPKYYKTMNSTVGKVTGLQSHAITYGLRFPAAFGHFMNWCGEDFAIFTWGEEDEKILRSNMILHELDTEILPKFYNLQVIFDELIIKSEKQCGLAAALEYYGLPMDIKAHDALNDAIYTERIALKMNFTQYLEGYDELIGEMERLKAERAQKSVKVYSEVEPEENVFESKKYTLCRCPGCKKIMRKGIFYHDTPDSAVTKAVCVTDGEYLARIVRSENEDGTYTVTRTLDKMTDEYGEIWRKAEKAGINTNPH